MSLLATLSFATITSQRSKWLAMFSIMLLRCANWKPRANGVPSPWVLIIALSLARRLVKIDRVYLMAGKTLSFISSTMIYSEELVLSYSF